MKFGVPIGIGVALGAFLTSLDVSIMNYPAYQVVIVAGLVFAAFTIIFGRTK